MARLQSFTRKYMTTLLLLFLAAGFAVIVAELTLSKHYEGVQLVGLISAIVGLVVALWGLIAKGGTRIALAWVMVVLALAGVVGVFEHNESGGEEAARPAAIAAAGTNTNISLGTPGVAQDSDDAPVPAGAGAQTSSDSETKPPPLAPLGLSGLALMGAVVLLAKRDPDETTVVK